MRPTHNRYPKIRNSMALLLAGAWTLAVPAHAADQAARDVSVHEKIVDTMTVLAKGPYPGLRANHAKGIVLTGSFTPSAQAPTLSKAPHFLKGTPVTVRFSNTTGVPTLADAAPNASPHGIAIRFDLPGGGMTDIVSISHNGFPVATPEDFLLFLNSVAATKPDSPKPTPVEQFLATHPAAKKFVSTPKPAPVSFATLAFFGVNAFQFTNAKGESQYARYRITPVAGMQALTDAQVKTAAPNYLMDELPQRLAKGPVQFRISAQLAAKGDNVNDGTAVWPDERPQIELGVLSLDQMVQDNKAAEAKLAFNPLLLPDGIAPSADPVLLSRPIAYAVSLGRRLSSQPPAK